ncbi:hypothetical protein BJX61DRAFT_547786 [Aspergillus egyptiacus]|nr:hypothetical protein BJX61DRAFT_547786 [Aspergillus egyptiacus]
MPNPPKLVEGVQLDAKLDGSDLDNYYSDHYHEYEVNEARALAHPLIFPRAEIATVTVTETETICGPAHEPTSVGDSSTVSIPETTVMFVTETPAPLPAPTSQPPVPGTGSEPSETSHGPEPTSVTATSSYNDDADEETTTFETRTSTHSSTVEATEIPTGTSTVPTDTAVPTVNAGFTPRGANSLALALALVFARLFGV